jgi:hypothetical protein
MLRYPAPRGTTQWMDESETRPKVSPNSSDELNESQRMEETTCVRRVRDLGE